MITNSALYQFCQAKRKYVLLLLFGFMVVAIQPLFSATYYVKHNATGANNGTSWTDAYTSFQSALNVAVSGDQIWVAKGTYKPSSAYDLTNTSRYYHFRMIEGVEIYGGFAGTEASVSQRTNFGMGGANETILSGDIGTVGNTSDNCYHVFYHPTSMTTKLTNQAILDGFSIKSGNADGTGDHTGGGGIYNSSNSPTIKNCVISDNTSSGNGSGIYNATSSVLIVNCRILKNISTVNSGPGIYNNNSTPTVINSIIHNNRGSGAYYEVNSSSTIKSSIIYGNYPSGYLSSSSTAKTTTIINSIIWGNSITQIGIYGSSIVHLISSCFRNNMQDVVGNPVLANCIHNDPLFVNPNAFDFRVLPGSPCLDAGDNTYNTELYDIRGGSYSRTLLKTDYTQNGMIDMGAYEFHSGMDQVVGRGIIYVNHMAAGNNDGTSWADAYLDLQQAIDVAITNDEIWVAKGVYKPSSTYDLINTVRYRHFRLKDGVKIFGGFSGNESSAGDRTQYAANEVNETILSGDLNDNGIDNGDSYHVIYHPWSHSLTNSSVLDGFTIRGGNANLGTDPHGYGGGIYNRGGECTFVNCNVRNNYAAQYGGGLYLTLTSCSLEQISIHSNISNNRGGGIYSSGYYGVSVNCQIHDNLAENDGGGLYTSGSVHFINSIFHNNAAKWGGAIYYSGTTGSQVIMTNCVIVDNTATTNGGGLYHSDGYCSSTFNNSILWGNNATTGKQIYMPSYGGTTNLNFSNYANGSNDIYLGTSSNLVTSNNNLVSDPLFIDPAGRDYRLFGNSPCVNSGENSYNATLTDLRGETRIQNAIIDRGVYEWSSGLDPAKAPIYVDFSKTSGSNNGTSWADAYTSFQAALNVAVSGDQIWVAKGTYKPSSAYDLTNTSRYYHFRMIEGVEIYGGFAGTETSVSQRTDFGMGGANETILSGDLNGDDIVTGSGATLAFSNNEENCYHVFYHPSGLGLTNSAVLDGFTVSGGNANDELAGFTNGGGMHLYSQSPLI